MTNDVVAMSTTFKNDGEVNAMTVLPAGIIQVTISTSTTKRPRYYCSGGHYSYRYRGDMVGAPGDWIASYIVVSKAGATVLAYPYILGGMNAEDVGAPVAITYVKIG